jgi:hypothetical protein
VRQAPHQTGAQLATGRLLRVMPALTRTAAQGDAPPEHLQLVHALVKDIGEPKATVLDEKGQAIKGAGDMPNQHDILTGSDSDGRAFPGGFDATCNNWTSNTDMNHAMLGHADRTGGGNVSWNSVHMSAGCSKESLIRTGGAGHLYCFAIN